MQFISKTKLNNQNISSFFLLIIVKNYPKLIICGDNSVQEQINAELSNLKITEQDYQNNLTKQKGILEYFIFQLTLEEQMIDLERIDLELIEKEFGELFIEESNPLTLTERILKVIKDFSIDYSLNIINNEYHNQNQLNIEREKYEMLLQQLRKINYQENCEVVEQLKLLISQTQIVVNLLKASINQDLQIFQSPIIERVNDLKEKFDEFKTKYDDKNNRDGKNTGQLNQLNNQIIAVDENNFQGKIRTNLSIIINIQQQLLIKARLGKQKLSQLLENVKHFTKNLHVIQECYFQMYKSFLICFYAHINHFQKSQYTNANLQQQENESSKEYFSRIQINKLCGENQLDENQIVIQPTNIVDFLYKLMAETKEKIKKSKWEFLEIQFDQEYLIQLTKKIYLQENNEEYEVKSNPQNQFSRDQQDSDEWKIKQGLVLTIIQISLNSFTETITRFCQKALIQLWVLEKDQRVRNLLKNQHLIYLQMQILQKNWQTQHDRISGKMQKMLSRIDELQEQISLEANLNKRDLQMKEMEETTQQLDEQIENISEMGQQLRLVTDFVNHIRKGLIRVEGKINEIKKQLKSMGNDIKLLRGKSVEQLFEIRKWKVLKEAAYKNVKSIFIPLQTVEIFHRAEKVEKEEQKTSILMNLEQLNDRGGEVNEFLLDEKQTVLLIHGVAGSGKSTTAKKIEEFIWKLHDSNTKIGKYMLIPVYISLPSLKNPVFQAVEETLHQDEYGFDDLQLKECKEMLEKKEFRLLLIMDSYDEMKLENIQKNLYINNKVRQNWSDPLVIFTTRSEIFTSCNYSLWFAPSNKKKLKEIKLQNFNSYQRMEYLKKFTIQSIKMQIFDIYEWQTQISNQQVDINKFESCWATLKQQFLNQEELNGEFLLNEKQIENIQQFLKNEEFFALKRNESFRSLSINLSKLWSVEKYENMMKQINLNKLMETPYMIEIIVQVLPEMMAKASEMINLKQHFISNFRSLLKKFQKSKYLIKKYQQQQKTLLNNQSEKEYFEDNLYDRNFKHLDKINCFEIAQEFWNIMEENSIPVQFWISQQNMDFNAKLFILIEHNLDVYHFFRSCVYNTDFQIQQIIELICDSLKMFNLTSYDFYNEFIGQCHQKQIEKQKKLGKSINVDRFLHDLQKYSTNLAKEMSMKQMTQVQFKQYGLLYKDEIEEEKWLNEFFNDDNGKYGSYKKDIRSCSLVQQKGTTFQFVHKSIQDFFIAADLYSIFVQSKDLNKQIFKQILEILSQETKLDQTCFEFLSKKKNLETLIKVEDLSNFDRQKKLDVFKKQFEQTINLMRILKQHEFNKINYSTEIYAETRNYLIKKIQKEVSIIEFLKFLVYLTAIDNSYIQGGSNSLSILVEMKVDLTNHNFEKIKVFNSSLIGGNFAKCNLSQSEFNDVNINGINLNGAKMFDCIWKNLRMNDLQQLEGHSRSVYSVCFSPDGTTLASGSSDNSVRLWDVKTGQQKAKLDGHTNGINSVCFSPDGNTLASGSSDNSIRLWDVKTGQQKAKLEGHVDTVSSTCFSRDGATFVYWRSNEIYLWDDKTGQQKSKLDGHTSTVWSVCFSPDGNTLASGSSDNSVRLWDLKTGQQKAKIDGHTNGINSVCFSPDGNTLASGSSDNSIRLWDVKTGQQKSKLDGHTNGINSVCFSPDGNTLASSSSRDQSICLLDVNTGGLKAKLDGQSGSVQQTCFSPDGAMFVFGSKDEYIRLWDVQTGQQKSKLDGHTGQVYSVCFSPDGNTLASSSADKSIRLWDVKTGQQKGDGHGDIVGSVCFSPDGITLASGSADKSIRLWDVKTGEQQSKLDGHSNTVNSVCFSPDGTKLASGSSDNFIRLWNVKTGELKATLDSHTSSVNSVSFSPDGTTLASGSADNFIRLWDVITEEQKAKLDGHSNTVNSVCFSPDKTMLASGSSDNFIFLWNVQTGELKAKLDSHTSSVNSVCFSPDGTTLASGSNDKSVHLWDVKTGELKAKLDSHTSSVNSVCFSPDGTTLASGSNDQSVHLWDVQTKEFKVKLDGHNNQVKSVCFSPDGNTLASGSADQSIRLWHVKTGWCGIKIEDHNDQVYFSPDGTILALGNEDQAFRFWDVKTASQIQPAHNSHKDLLQFKTTFQCNNFTQYDSSNITILLISQSIQFQSKRALIFRGEFLNYQNFDSLSYFKSKGSILLEYLLNYISRKKN